MPIDNRGPRAHPLLHGCLGLLASCVEPTVPAIDAAAETSPSGAPRVMEVRVLDRAGHGWSLSAAPRQPVVRVRSSAPLMGDPEPFVILEGPPDPELASDLRTRPPRAATLARALEVARERDGSWTELRPNAPLVPGNVYTVAVAGWAYSTAGVSLGDPFLAELRVVNAKGGASVTDTWPADGTSDVPASIPWVALRLDDVVAEGIEAIRLVGASLAAEDSRAGTVACETVGWNDGHCVRITLVRPLDRDEAYRIVVPESVRDRTGAAIGTFEAAFRTGSRPPPFPTWLTEACAIDERPFDAGCVLASDRDVTLRVGANGSLRLWFSAEGKLARAVAPQGRATLTVEGLGPDRAFTGRLVAIDLAGVTRVFTFDFSTTPALPPLFITEVRADPVGPEPNQEYVELLNAGSRAVELEGLRLSDGPDREGDVIDQPYVLAPSGRALLVGPSFDPTGPDDDPVPPGVPVVRMANSLATSGLSNRGEPLFLRDASGNRLSAVPATPPPKRGVCVVRTRPHDRSGAAGTFAYDAANGCTPGGPDRTPRE